MKPSGSAPGKWCFACFLRVYISVAHEWPAYKWLLPNGLVGFKLSVKWNYNCKITNDLAYTFTWAYTRRLYICAFGTPNDWFHRKMVWRKFDIFWVRLAVKYVTFGSVQRERVGDRGWAMWRPLPAALCDCQLDGRTDGRTDGPRSTH